MDSKCRNSKVWHGGPFNVKQRRQPWLQQERLLFISPALDYTTVAECLCDLCHTAGSLVDCHMFVQELWIEDHGTLCGRPAVQRAGVERHVEGWLVGRLAHAHQLHRKLTCHQPRHLVAHLHGQVVIQVVRLALPHSVKKCTRRKSRLARAKAFHKALNVATLLLVESLSSWRTRRSRHGRRYRRMHPFVVVRRSNLVERFGNVGKDIDKSARGGGVNGYGAVTPATKYGPPRLVKHGQAALQDVRAIVLSALQTRDDILRRRVVNVVVNDACERVLRAPRGVLDSLVIRALEE
mmetsp:Transcript_43746/g.107394  ORF Transcript_43746/g.107394 Transcript_43746/m.107394 type:complete len:294 (+) Transcript_43746:1143-2024(+)